VCKSLVQSGLSKFGPVRLLVASLDREVEDQLQTGCNWSFTLTIGEAGGGGCGLDLLDVIGWLGVKVRLKLD